MSNNLSGKNTLLTQKLLLYYKNFYSLPRFGSFRRTLLYVMNQISVLPCANQYCSLLWGLKRPSQLTYSIFSESPLLKMNHSQLDIRDSRFLIILYKYVQDMTDQNKRKYPCPTILDTLSNFPQKDLIKTEKELVKQFQLEFQQHEENPIGGKSC